MDARRSRRGAGRVTDAEILRRAARILRRESTKPNSFLLNTYCRVLTDKADKLEAKEQGE